MPSLFPKGIGTRIALLLRIGLLISWLSLFLRMICATTNGSFLQRRVYRRVYKLFWPLGKKILWIWKQNICDIGTDDKGNFYFIHENYEQNSTRVLCRGEKLVWSVCLFLLFLGGIIVVMVILSEQKRKCYMLFFFLARTFKGSRLRNGVLDICWREEPTRLVKLSCSFGGTFEQNRGRPSPQSLIGRHSEIDAREGEKTLRSPWRSVSVFNTP